MGGLHLTKTKFFPHSELLTGRCYGAGVSLTFLPPPPCSQDGTVSTWSSSLQLQRGNKLQGDPLQQQVGGATRSGGGRRGTLRVTDAAVMSDCGRLVVSTTSCELAFYDTTNYHCKYRLQGACHVMYDCAYICIYVLLLFVFSRPSVCASMLGLSQQLKSETILHSLLTKSCRQFSV